MPKKETVNTKEKKEVAPTIDLTEIKTELRNYVDEHVNDEFIKRIDNANKLLIKEKNKKILGKNIWINILLLVIVFLLYLLNNEGFFMRVVNNTPVEYQGTPREIVPSNTDSEVKDTGPTLSELIETYGPLLNNVTISDNSAYLEDYYNGNLTDELKNYLALNNLSSDKITTEDDYSSISEYDLEDSYNDLFNSEFTNHNFDYNGNKIRYYKKISSYLTETALEKTPSSIKREIIDIKVNESTIDITCIEALITDDKTFNIITKEEITDEGNLKELADKLTIVTYTFKDGKLISIKK